MEATTFRMCKINVPDEVKISHRICGFEKSNDPMSGKIGAYKLTDDDCIASIVLSRYNDECIKITLFLTHQNDDNGIRTTYWLIDDMRSLKKAISTHAEILTQWIRELE